MASESEAAVVAAEAEAEAAAGESMATMLFSISHVWRAIVADDDDDDVDASISSRARALSHSVLISLASNFASNLALI